jgi:hypothetical protein
MAALLTPMGRDGLVSRKLHPEDKRASLVSLTPKARAKLPEVKQKLVEEARKATAGLSDAETKTLNFRVTDLGVGPLGQRYVVFDGWQPMRESLYCDPIKDSS